MLNRGKCKLCGKDNYESRRIAKLAVSRMFGASGTTMHYYRCPSGWVHFTSESASRTAEFRERRAEEPDIAAE